MTFTQDGLPEARARSMAGQMSCVRFPKGHADEFRNALGMWDRRGKFRDGLHDGDMIQFLERPHVHLR